MGKILITISIGLIAIGIAITSDKKMKDLARSYFLGVMSIFEDGRIKLIEKWKLPDKELKNANVRLRKATR